MLSKLRISFTSFTGAEVIALLFEPIPSFSDQLHAEMEYSAHAMSMLAEKLSTTTYPNITRVLFAVAPSIPESVAMCLLV